eukprot:776679-Rhodomonas_salina.1
MFRHWQASILAIAPAPEITGVAICRHAFKALTLIRLRPGLGGASSGIDDERWQCGGQRCLHPRKHRRFQHQPQHRLRCRQVRLKRPVDVV